MHKQTTRDDSPSIGAASNISHLTQVDDLTNRIDTLNKNLFDQFEELRKKLNMLSQIYKNYPENQSNFDEITTIRQQATEIWTKQCQQTWNQLGNTHDNLMETLKVQSYEGNITDYIDLRESDLMLDKPQRAMTTTGGKTNNNLRSAVRARPTGNTIVQQTAATGTNFGAPQKALSLSLRSSSNMFTRAEMSGVVGGFQAQVAQAKTPASAYSVVSWSIAPEEIASKDKIAAGNKGSQPTTYKIRFRGKDGYAKKYPTDVISSLIESDIYHFFSAESLVLVEKKPSKCCRSLWHLLG